MSFLLGATVPHFLNMFWQIPDGEIILAGHLPQTVSYAIESGPLVSQEWFFEAALALAARAHLYGAFVLVCALAAAATPLLVYAATRTFGVADLPAGIVALAAVGSRFSGSAIRPETFAVDLFAIEIALLARRRGVLGIVLCVVAWANLHASVILAVFAAGAFAVGDVVERGARDRATLRSAGITAATALATLLTPHGVRLWTYAFALTVGANPVREHLTAWRPLAFDSAGALTAVLPGLLLFVVAGAVLRRRFTTELLLAAIGFAITLAHARYATFLAAAWAPALGRSIETRFRSLRGGPNRRAPLAALAPIVIVAIVAGGAALRSPLEPEGVWQTAASIASAMRLEGNTYAPYEWAAFLHWKHLPIKLLIDAHGDPYPADVWNDHLALDSLQPNWREVLDRRGIMNVVVERRMPLASALALDPAWKRIADRHGVVAYARVAQTKSR